MSLREDADKITQAAIQASLPDAAVAQALQTHHLQGNLYVIAVGKAAWQMADAAAKTLGSRIKHGVVITKYNHSKGAIGALDIFEAGHPVPDENSVLATKAAIALAEPLQASDIVIFLLASIAQTWHNGTKSIAFFAGGETVAHLQGTGLGGRNQELALAAAEGISGLKQTAIFSVGSDGTDGPTDAAGGYVDGDSFEVLRKKGVDVSRVLQENDSYHALAACDGLIVTAPTGTNVNDMAVVLIRREETEGRLETQHQGST